MNFPGSGGLGGAGVPGIPAAGGARGGAAPGGFDPNDPNVKWVCSGCVWFRGVVWRVLLGGGVVHT